MRRVSLFVLVAAALLGHAASASAQATRAPRYRDAKSLGGKTSFYLKRPLTDAASLKAMADTPRMERDITTVFTEAGIRNAAEVSKDVIGVMRAQLTPRRGGSCTTESANEGELVECSFPVGGTMPFMAYRPGGAAHALKNFRWAGDAPFDAFMFRVYSRGTTYTVIMPKPCGNISLLAQTPPEVRVNKLAKESRVAAGNPVTFTIGVSNAAPNGSASARNVVVEDTLPTANGLNWTLGSADPNCTLTGGTLTCRYAELAPSDSRLITVTSATPTPFSACAVLQNTASATSDNAAPARGSDTSTCVAPVLKVVKGPKNGTFTIGHAATFTVTVTNDAPAGASSATNVVLTDTLPTTGGLEWQPATSTKGTCEAGATLRCAIGTLAPGESATVTIASRPAPIAACQSIPNTARATATGDLAAEDSATLTCTPAKLVVEKTPDNGTFKQSEQVKFQIVVRNAAPAGASDATNVKLNDVLPTEGGLSWDSASASAGTCALSGQNKGTLACDLGTIAAGQAVTITVQSPAKTPMGACQAQTNAAARATADGGLTAEDSGSLTCERSFWFFGDVFGGKDRRVRPIAGVNTLDGDPVRANAGGIGGLDYAQCSPMVGLNLGIGKRLPNNWELAATAGLAASVVQAGHKVREHQVTLDVEANKYLKNGMFLGTGVSMWDLFHSDSFEPALLTHFGVPLGTHPTHPIYFVGEGRLFFRQLDDVANNYQFWGGLRVHF